MSSYNSINEQDKNKECETNSSPLNCKVISNPHHDHQAGPQAQINFNDIQPQLPDKPKTQISDIYNNLALLQISEVDSEIDKINKSTQTLIEVTTNTTIDEAEEIIEEKKGIDYWYSVPTNPPPQPRPPPPTITTVAIQTITTLSSISTPNGMEIVELITTTTQRTTLYPHIVPTSSQNTIENYMHFLNEINEKLGKSYRFSTDHVEINRENENLKNFITNLGNFILGNNENQQDFSIVNCQTALTFVKSQLNVVTSATLRIQLENLKTNLMYTKFFLSNNFQFID
ncbi:hypothetical protein ACTFIY_008938 [Dictyostelium cf. discoideum]